MVKKNHPLFDYLKSAKIFTVTMMVFSFALLYNAMNTQVKTDITFSIFISFSSICLWVMCIITSRIQSIHTFYHWSSLLNYTLSLAIVIYYFIWSKNYPIAVFGFFIAQVYVLILLSQIYNFFILNHHEFSELRLLNNGENPFNSPMNVALSLSTKFSFFTANGIVKIGYGDLYFNNKKFDMYHVQHYFEKNGPTIMTVTNDDFLVMEMLDH